MNLFIVLTGSKTRVPFRDYLLVFSGLVYTLTATATIKLIDFMMMFLGDVYAVTEKVGQGSGYIL